MGVQAAEASVCAPHRCFGQGVDECDDDDDDDEHDADDWGLMFCGCIYRTATMERSFLKSCCMQKYKTLTRK